MADKLKQKAGENSNQFSANSVDTVNQMQVGTMNIQNGITAADCISICNHVFLSLAREYSEEAMREAEQRNNIFSNDVVNRLSNVESALEEFKKPEFQSLLVKAQRTATRTSNVDDYNLLSELIAQKVEKRNDKKIGTGINKAVEIVDEIDNDSLLALTVLCAIKSYVPTSGYTKDYVMILDDLYKKIIYNPLPKSYEWMDQLDILNCVRVSSLKFRKFYDYLISRAKGIFCLGIEKNSQCYNDCVNILNSAFLPQILVDNELNSKYVRIPVVTKDDIKNLVLLGGVPLNPSQQMALEQIYDKYSNDSNELNVMKKNAYNLFDTYSTIRIVKEWWDNCPNAIDITIVGKTLAYSNLCRIDPTLPKIY